MDAVKQKLIDVCKINIEDDENLIRIAKETHFDDLLRRATADKEENERKLKKLLEQEGM